MLPVRNYVALPGESMEWNRSAVDAISERVAEVTALAEELDAALCAGSNHPHIEKITDLLDSPPTHQEEWYGSLDKRGSPMKGGEESSRSEEEFAIASECTCTPPSRSSSYHTASEGEPSYLWWQSDAERTPQHEVVTGVVTQEVRETQQIKLSREGCSLTTDTVTSETCTEEIARPGSVRHQLKTEPKPKKEDALANSMNEVKDWLELKVLEVTPCLTQLGETLHEAQVLTESHYDVIKKIQSKRSPVDELLRAADEAVAKQTEGPRSVNNRPEVYAAMAESLTAVWNNINAHLHTRKRILDLNLDYHRYAKVYDDKCDSIEEACRSGLPIEIEEMRLCLDRLKELNREMLQALNGALHHGSSLIQVLNEIKEEGTLDSRPGQIKFRAQLAKHQVEKWMERLHERRSEVTCLWEVRKKEVEECLGLALITADLAMLHHLLEERTDSLLRSTDQLGDAHASAQLLLHEHKKLIPEAKDLQEQALKIVKATEEFALGGHFAGPEAISKAYQLLEEAAAYLHHIDSRESTLCRSIEFFDHAHSALIKLDQLEVQLKTGDLGLGMAQLEQLHSNVAQSLEEVTAQPLQLGYSLIQDVPSAEGVKRMVEQIENKKINLSVQCTAHKEENVKANRMYTNFIEKYEQLYTWLMNMEAYLSGVKDLGINLITSTDFLQIYRKNLNDVQMKGSEINALRSTIPATVQFLDENRSTEIKEKGDTLSKKWNELNTELEMRTELGAIYVKAHDLLSKLSSELDNIEAIIKTEGDEASGNQSWVTCQQLEPQLNNTSSKFNHESKKVVSALDGEGARLCLETKCEQLASRRACLEADWNNWLQQKEARQQARIQWDTNMAASSKTVDWVTKLDAQLYPILNEDLHSPRQLASHVEDKQSTILPEIKKAQKEIQLRIETVEDLVTKGGIQGYNEGIPLRLKELNNRLLGISTDYQVLLEKLLTFFNSLSQVETRVEAVQMEEKTSVVPLNLMEAERMRREFETTKQEITEMFNMCLIDSGHIITKIKLHESNSQKDIRTVERAVETLRYNWQKISTGRERTIDKYLRRCQFDNDLSEIYQSLEHLSGELDDMTGQYGDSLASAQACLISFTSFEQIIKILEDRIIRFIDIGEEMVGCDAAGDHIENELTLLRERWQLLKNQIAESRHLIVISVQFFMLVEEAEHWFREGNRLLVTIASRLNHVNTVEDATQLLNDIETFLKPGEETQYQRISEITKLGEKLQRKGSFPPMVRVQEENKEILESFSQISSNLKILCEKLDKPPERVVEPVVEPAIEPMETEHKVDLVIDLRKTRHETEEITRTIIHKIEIERDTSPLVSEPQDEEKKERLKSPSPPPKKVKYLEELPVTQEPYFTVPLHDATVEEGNRFTFECSVKGTPVPEVVWEKDGISIENNPDYQTKFDEGVCSLTIEETFAEDSARFICRASNSAGSAETSAVLTIKESEPVEEVSPPVFVTPLSGVSVTEGGKLELKCLVAGLPLPTVQWFMGSRCLDNDPAYFISFNNGNALLVKESVQPDDHGSYSCVASNPLGTETSVAKVNIDRKEPREVPTFALELGNVMARAGQKIKLECEARGIPDPELSWTHDGKPIKENRDIKITTECNKTSLVINEAFPKDAGAYTVTAVNAAGSVSTTSQVMVKGRLPAETSDSELPSDMEPTKPSIQLSLRDQSVFEGKKVRLDCVIIGHPEPEVIWYHNDRPVKESSDIQLTFQGDRCSLIIREAFLEDTGTYKVVAINSAGEASSWCMLNVQAIDKSTEHATRHPVEEVKIETSVEGQPKFTKMPTDALATQGDNVTFECVVSGIPAPTVSWALNNIDIQQSDRTHMTQDSEGNCNLKITGVLPEDKGVYTAKAVNQQGEAKCFAQLIVKTPVTLDSVASPQPEEKLMSPAFSELFADRTVPEGQSTKFECIVTGKPMPKIRWLFNDELVSGKDFLVSTSGNRQVLSLPKVTRALAGKIACVAENEAGKSSCVAKLTVTEPSLISLLPSLDNIGLQEIQQDGNVFAMKRAVFMQSSTSSHYSSVTGSGSQPVVQMQTTSSKSEMASQKIGDQPAVQVESHRTSEYSNIGGIESRHESETVKSSGGDMLPPKLMKPQRKSMPPRFISPLNGCIVDQGADVTLEAIIEGYPVPSIAWTKNGAPCSTDLETSYEFGKARLKLVNVKTPDGGRYSLTATNPAGTAASTADVVVKKSSFPPVMGKRLQATSAYVGDRVVLEVEVTGTPTPTITWHKNDQLMPQVTANSKLQSFGNSHSLVIEKASVSDSGKYSVLATNCAGESRSTADLLITEKPQELPPTSSLQFQSFLDRSILQGLEQHKLPSMSSVITPQKESVVVSESFKSEKQVSMKVHHSSQSVDIQMPTWEPKSQLSFSAEKFDTSGSVKEEKKESDSVVEDSITKKSALDFFKNIIKENEDESKKKESFEVLKPSEPQFTSHSPVASSVFQEFESMNISEKTTTESQSVQPSIGLSDFILEPGPPPEMGFVPKGTVSKPKEEMADRVKKLEETTRRLSETEVPLGGVKIFPTPPPKMESPPREKKTETVDYSSQKVEEVVVPTKIEPVGIGDWTFRQLETLDSTPAPIFRPSADIDVRPVSPRPSAEGISMEKLWTSHHKEESTIQPMAPVSIPETQESHKAFESKFESKSSVSQQSVIKSVQPPVWKPVSLPPLSSVSQISLERPKSPGPSAEGLAMDKLWGHKYSDSSISKTVWPPPESSIVQSPQISTEKYIDKSITSSESHVRESFSKMSVQESVKEHKTFHETISQPVIKPEIKPMDKIIYVAEAHATHSSNLIDKQQIISHVSSSSEFQESASREETKVVEEKTLKPSEAKKIWPEGLPVEIEKKPKPKQEFKPQPVRPPSIQDLKLDDINIEPGPPPEIGFATPTHVERRQSYVETIEQGLQKDLEKEPSKHLVGAVRTIPPPLKKEKSVEPQIQKTSSKFESMQSQEIKSSFTTSEDSSFKPFPQLEPFPFKPETVKPPPTKFSTVPRPSKFVKKSFTESDYDSEVESTKIKARWTPWDSDTEELLTYRKVKPPTFVAQPKRSQSVEPTPPSQHPPLYYTSRTTACFTSTFDRQTRKKFETQVKTVKTKSETTDISLKPGSPPIFLQAQPKKPETKPDSPKSKKRAPAVDSGYMADTDEPQKFMKQTRSMTSQSNVSSHISRTEKHVIQSSKLEKKSSSTTKSLEKKETSVPKVMTQELEPFPFKAEPSVCPTKRHIPPPPSPSKFVRGEFKESDYESDYEGRIKPIWRPLCGDGHDPSFRPVKPVLTPVPTPKKQREPTPPSEFDQPPTFTDLRPKFQPIEKPLTPVKLTDIVQVGTEKKLVRPMPVQTAPQPPRDSFDIKPGSPPKMDFAPPHMGYNNAVETSNTMSFTEATESSRRVVSMQQTTRVISFDQSGKKVVERQTSLPSKFVQKGDAKWATDSESEMTKKELTELDIKAEQRRLKRVEEMRKRFGEKTSQSVVDLKPGEPPKFDYAPPRIPAPAAIVADKHVTEMTSAFKSKTQQFSNDIMKQVKQNGQKESRKDEPQAYKEESRVAEYGTKHIDPDTGLIYFKYDFGYEFGVVMPGEGGQRSKDKRPGIKAESDKDKEGSIVVPVIHETTAKGAKKKTAASHVVKSVKWDPTSESEFSEAEDTMGKKMMHQRQQPRITIPIAATPSPQSLSPSLPSLSPYYTSQGHDNTVTGHQWTSETSSPCSYSQTPPVVNASMHGDLPKKAPLFITPLKDIAVVTGRMARFECIVQAEPAPNILWAKGGRIIEPSANHQIEFRNGVCRLTLPQAFEYDAGTYSCTATNLLGTKETKANLQVSGEGRTYISK